MITSYIDAFEDLRLELPMVTDDEALDQFVSGLKPAATTHVTEKNSCDYDEAVQMVLAYKSGRRLGYGSTMQTSTPEYLQHNGVAPMDDPHHAQSNVTGANEWDILNAIAETKHGHIKNWTCNTDAPLSSLNTLLVTSMQRNFQIMIHAMNAMSVQSLPLYEITICDQRFKALIDSGPGQCVETANGQLTAIEGQASLLGTLSDYKTNFDAMIFNSKFDVILRNTWLQQVALVPNWVQQTWTITDHGYTHVLHSITHTDKQEDVSSLLLAKQVMKLLCRDEAQCYLVHLQEDALMEVKNQEWIQKLVHEFKEVFCDDVVGLPPQRDVQHVIDTQDAIPVNRTPYKMSPQELDELQ
ncbi:hypothetical protein DFQ30_001899 [Apophysomyces sp. BC1015]|nr:hypothetical protein DFQ30_001899 [Apophysomyces sp. BC1015]